MTPPDKASAANRQQLQQQLDFFQQFTARAFDNAERILALNMAATRTALDQTSGAVRQLAAARDPRDLLALTAQSQQQIDAVMTYSRKLFEIAGKPAAAAAAAPAPESAPAPAPESAPAAATVPEPASAPAPAPAPEDHIVTAAPVIVSEPVADAAPAVPDPVPVPVPAPGLATPDTVPVVPAVFASAHPLGETDPVPAPVSIARPKPIARAVSKVVAAPVDTPHPAASPMPPDGPVPTPAITPAPAKRSSGAAPKGSRKR